jgi:hypothetical protein
MCPNSQRTYGEACRHAPTDWPSKRRPAYAGIGSRETPPALLALMARVAAQLATQRWVLRTGLAGGADQAFYRGAVAGGTVELYLPWPSFEASARLSGPRELALGQPSQAAYELASRFHPAWAKLRSGARRLHARNCHQVLGVDLATPAKFVLCWTPDGSLDGSGRRVGGTGQALRVAHHHGVPVSTWRGPSTRSACKQSSQASSTKVLSHPSLGRSADAFKQLTISP